MCYPALQHLQLGWFPTHIHEATLLSMLHATAPTLSTIRLSVFFTSGTTSIFSTMKTTLPIKKIILHPFAASAHDVLYQDWRNEYLRNLRKNGQSDDSLVLLKSKPTQTLQLRAVLARERWSEACAGRINYWEPTEGELDPEVLASISAAWDHMFYLVCVHHPLCNYTIINSLEGICTPECSCGTWDFWAWGVGSGSSRRRIVGVIHITSACRPLWSALPSSNSERTLVRDLRWREITGNLPMKIPTPNVLGLSTIDGVCSNPFVFSGSILTSSLMCLLITIRQRSSLPKIVFWRSSFASTSYSVGSFP